MAAARPGVAWRAALLFAAVSALCLARGAQARIHDLVISGDSRAVFSIETFGFFAGGRFNFDLTGFKITGDAPFKAGFVLHPSESESAEVELVQEAAEEGACLLDAVAEDFVVPLNDPAGWAHTAVDREMKVEGLYDVLFVRCLPKAAEVSFELKLTLYNPGPNYLSAGDVPLPTLYALMAVIFFGTLATWVVYLRKHAAKVQTLHRMMSVLLVLKALALTFESVTFHFVAARGSPVGWNVVYYIFAFLKGVMMFVVILLVGTGWSLLKPFLSQREKKIFLLVLPLQVLDNIALLVVNEMAPGSQAYQNWNNILHLVDIFCCCAILLPIVWSISHLRQASTADGKARDTLQRLLLFRQFYIMVVGYIYFTRIVVWILRDTIAFDLAWMSILLQELATLAFFVATGWKFRPTSENPYVKVRTEDDDEDEAEFGLQDGPGDVELAATKREDK
eukprot:CAMPEP_0203814060 /NCGR_PEP_ID=MMETSP0115-20131106/5065_1 /ASSEMBLY_ACC=CAM_ASM_000227 /TAXON_ID=33651 /ORGANISM="Bicosoecid sp, Strain ms1" /LENGTH=449 /DNA_ID=CAMNT_0050722937 /DNA_START=240 /DNA_END=1589 /DNA_ORIENTATION=+